MRLREARFTSGNHIKFRGWRLGVRPGREIPTPAIAGGRIFFGGGFGAHEFYAVELATGALAWQLRTKDDGPTAGVTDGEIVAFNTESCTLDLVRTDNGKTEWSRWLGDPLLAQPALGSGLAVMAFPKRGSHFLAAFDVASGEPVWEMEIGHDVITAPVIVADEVYVSTYDGAVSCFDLLNGALKWRRLMHATSAPWVYEGEVYVSQRTAGERGNRTDAARSAEPDVEERIGSVEKLRGLGVRAFQEKKAEYLKAGWGAGRKSDSAWLDAQVGFAQPPSTAKLDVVSGLVGEHRVSRAWRFQGSRPVVVDGILFETTGDVLTARKLTDGHLLWEWRGRESEEGERQITPPAVAHGRVLIGTWDGRLVSLDAVTGIVRWEVKVGAPVHWQPVMANGWISAGLANGELIAFHTGDKGDGGWAMWGGGPGHNGEAGAHREAARKPESSEEVMNDYELTETVRGI